MRILLWSRWNLISNACKVDDGTNSEKDSKLHTYVLLVIQIKSVGIKAGIFMLISFLMVICWSEFSISDVKNMEKN